MSTTAIERVELPTNRTGREQLGGIRRDRIARNGYASGATEHRQMGGGVAGHVEEPELRR